MQENVAAVPLAMVLGCTILINVSRFMAGSRAVASSMYAHVKDTDAPESKESNRNTRLMASSASRLLVLLYDVQLPLVHPNSASSFLKP